MRTSFMIRTVVSMVSLAAVVVPAHAAGPGFGNVFGAMAARTGGMGGERGIDEALVKVSNQMNRKMPMEIDASTRLDKVSSEPGHKLVYHYTLLKASSADIKTVQFATLIKPSLTTRVCGSPEMQGFLKNGVTITYLYRGSDGKPMGGTDVKQLDCARIG
jgi:hypothetical protein